MPNPNAIEPTWVIQWCPFCYWTLTTNTRMFVVSASPGLTDVEQVISEHLAEHVEEMMAVVS